MGETGTVLKWISHHRRGVVFFIVAGDVFGATLMTVAIVFQESRAVRLLCAIGLSGYIGQFVSNVVRRTWEPRPSERNHGQLATTAVAPPREPLLRRINEASREYEPTIKAVSTLVLPITTVVGLLVWFINLF
jgi:type VI protein secretion system component VasK